MREDQIESLQKRQEQLVDLFLEESDPTRWPGHGVAPSAMDKSTRGDRYWCKKDSLGTLACATRIAGLIEYVRHHDRETDNQPKDGGSDGLAEKEVSLDADIADAEKQADAIMRRVKEKLQDIGAKK